MYVVYSGRCFKQIYRMFTAGQDLVHLCGAKMTLSQRQRLDPWITWLLRGLIVDVMYESNTLIDN